MNKNIFSILTLTAMFVFGITTLPLAKEGPTEPLELDGTEWVVTMAYMSKKGKKVSEEDTLKFMDKKFISSRFDKKGYDPTNYSLTLEEDGTTKFGTMQVKGKETSFWKGTVKDGKINGSVHTQFSGGESNRTSYFNGSLAGGELKEKEPWKPTPPLAEQKPAPAVTPPTVDQVPAEGVEDKSVLDKAAEAVGGAVEKVQDLVGNNKDAAIIEAEENAGDVAEQAVDPVN